MIRRGFWLATGAVLGVTGYRRATRVASMLSAPRSRALAPPVPRPRAVPSGGKTAIRVLRSSATGAVAAAGFVRDVRAGMAEYRELHRAAPGRTPGGPELEGRNLEATGDRTPSGEWRDHCEL
jgi:hypothetical protein